jgi:two-component system OmpR family sensor kinase
MSGLSLRRRRHRRLQRMLFWSFGAAILATIMVAAIAFWISRRYYSPGPWIPFFIMFGSGNVVWMLSGIAAHRIARPLRELTRATRDFGHGNLTERARVSRWGADEIVELSQAFNDMAQRIEAQIKSQRELLGAVSHELRTPLARLRVLVGSLAEQSGDAKLASHMEREIHELDALVGELLAGARVDAGALQKRALDVSDTVRVCLERLGISDAVVHIAPECARVEADATLLSRALTVLLDNARKHGGKHIAVRVELAASGAQAATGGTRFCVEDDGEGFEADDIRRLFEPFTRGRGAQPDEQRGLGLGLYLVRRIAEAHGGKVFATNRPEGGAAIGFVLS